MRRDCAWAPSVCTLSWLSSFTTYQAPHVMKVSIVTSGRVLGTFPVRPLSCMSCNSRVPKWATVSQKVWLGAHIRCPVSLGLQNWTCSCHTVNMSPFEWKQRKTMGTIILCKAPVRHPQIQFSWLYPILGRQNSPITEGLVTQEQQHWLTGLSLAHKFAD